MSIQKVQPTNSKQPTKSSSVFMDPSYKILLFRKHENHASTGSEVWCLHLAGHSSKLCILTCGDRVATGVVTAGRAYGGGDSITATALHTAHVCKHKSQGI